MDRKPIRPGDIIEVRAGPSGPIRRGEVVAVAASEKQDQPAYEVTWADGTTTRLYVSDRLVTVVEPNDAEPGRGRVSPPQYRSVDPG